jgi:MFS family permease
MKLKYPRMATSTAFALIPLSGFVTDMYIPSMPGMAAALHASTIQVQLTLTFFLISYGVFQLFVGTLLDSYGRYKLSLISLVLLALSNIAIAVTHHIYLIYAMRVVQGITVSFIVVGKRAFFSDVYTGDKTALSQSLLDYLVDGADRGAFYRRLSADGIWLAIQFLCIGCPLDSDGGAGMDL